MSRFAMVFVRLVVLLLGAFNVEVASTGLESEVTHGNPIRRIIKLVTDMQTQVEADGRAKQRDFDDSLCYCKKNLKSLQDAIAKGEVTIPQLQSVNEEMENAKLGVENMLEKDTNDRTAAETALENARALRRKEQAEFEAEKNELQNNLKILKLALMSIQEGLTSFFQSSAAGRLKQLSTSIDMLPVDRDTLTAFLAGHDTVNGGTADSASNFQPNTEEVVGILKQMQEDMQKNLDSIIAENEIAIPNYQKLRDAKEKEIDALTRQISQLTERNGELSVEIANNKNSISNSQEELEENQEFFTHLTAECKQKGEEFDKWKEIHREELTAVSQAIRILNEGNPYFIQTKQSAADTDDSFLQISSSSGKSSFRAGTSFMQTKMTRSEEAARHGARQVLARRHRGRRDPRVDLIELALVGKSRGVSDVVKQVYKLVEALKHEQEMDDQRYQHCVSELKKSSADMERLKDEVSATEKALDESQETMNALVTEIAQLSQGIKDLDKSVFEATKLRKKENNQYKDEMQMQVQSKEVMRLSRKRLDKFYKSKKTEWTGLAQENKRVAQEDKAVSDDENADSFMQMGMKVGAKARAKVGVKMHARMHAQEASQASTEESDDTSDEDTHLYELVDGAKAHTDARKTAIDQIYWAFDMLEKEVELAIKATEQDEKDAQAAYEKLLTDSEEKRALDSQSVMDKENAKAVLEEQMQKMERYLTVHKVDAEETEKYYLDLKLQCNWQVENYKARKDARSDETEGLTRVSELLRSGPGGF